MKNIKLGPTGNFPRGKLNAEDEGGLAIALGKNPDGVIIMDFGKEVGWIGLNQATAINIARSILTLAGAKRIEIEF